MLRSRKLFCSFLVLLVIQSACSTSPPLSRPTTGSTLEATQTTEDIAPSPVLATPSPSAALQSIGIAAQSQNSENPSPNTNADTSDELCDNDYFPSDEGATWTFTGQNSKTGAYSRTDTVTDSRDDGFTISTQLKDVSYIEEYNCTEAGLINLEIGKGDLVALFSGKNGNVALIREHNSGITIPRDIEPGSTWQQFLAWRTPTPASNGSFTYNFTAMGPEVVSVPAGNYDAMRIDVMIDVEINAPDRVAYTYTNSIWLVNDIGLVKSEGSSDQRGVEFTDVLELESFDSP